MADIYAYIASDSPRTALTYVMKLHATGDSLRRSWLRGRIVPEDPTKTHRELIHGNYRIMYRVKEQVEIVAVIHSARDLSRLPRRPWDVH